MPTTTRGAGVGVTRTTGLLCVSEHSGPTLSQRSAIRAESAASTRHREAGIRAKFPTVRTSAKASASENPGHVPLGCYEHQAGLPPGVPWEHALQRPDEAPILAALAFRATVTQTPQVAPKTTRNSQRSLASLEVASSVCTSVGSCYDSSTHVVTCNVEDDALLRPPGTPQATSRACIPAAAIARPRARLSNVTASMRRQLLRLRARRPRRRPSRRRRAVLGRRPATTSEHARVSCDVRMKTAL